MKRQTETHGHGHWTSGYQIEWGEKGENKKQ